MSQSSFHLVVTCMSCYSGGFLGQ